MDIDLTEIVLRLGIAMLAAGAVGLNRDLHGKPIGVRTLGLVGLSTAVVVLLSDAGIAHAEISDATSRVVQGILTGIGSLVPASSSIARQANGCMASPVPPASGLPHA